MRPRILHLTADYPDTIQPSKTHAVARLIEGTADQFDHRVISLNRTGGLFGAFWPGQLLERRQEGDVLAIRYASPPAVIAIGPALAILAKRLAGELQRIGFKPDLIQGHKLTIEGRLAQRLATRLGVPYALTLQGNTDQKLLTLRPDRAGMVRRVWHGASGIMAFAPWTAAWCSQQLGRRSQPIAIIPCILSHDAILAPVLCGQLVRTAFRLDFWRNKNIATLLQAVALLAVRFPGVRLEIAGDGAPAAAAVITAMIARLGLHDRVKLVSQIEPDAIQQWFNGAAVFALPSRRESFGMVFAEALLAGTPVIYPSGGAIDGYFIGRPFARSVVADDAQALAAALAAALTQQAAIKADLAAAQSAGELDRFRRDQVLSAYTRFVQQALR